MAILGNLKMAKSEARRFKRVGLRLPVTITINTVDRYEGELVNISPGNLAVIADTNAVQGDAVVARIKGLDVIEGTGRTNYAGWFRHVVHAFKKPAGEAY